MLLSDLLDENIQRYGEYTMMYDGNQAYTNIETMESARKYALVLDKYGIGKGDRVVVCMANCPEVIYSYQGSLRTGAVVIPLMHLLHSNEINFILKDSETKAVVTSSAVLPKIVEAVQALETKPTIFVVDKKEGFPHSSDIELIDISQEMTDMEPRREQKADLDTSDVGVILYTSGTTGNPKGVMLTHHNLYNNADTSVKMDDNGERGTTIGVLPLAHAFGFTAMNTLILGGSSVAIFDKFEIEPLFETIDKYQIKIFAAVPAMIYAMVQSPLADRYDLSSLESVVSGSAPLPVSILHAFKQKFNADIREGYGLSEATTVVSGHRKGIPIKPGSVGIPLPGVEIKIVDEQDNEVPVGKDGELIVYGENISPGYFKREEETKKTIKNGWLYTGDIAKVDEEGYLYIVERKKDMIIRGGFNIYPRDLEELIVKYEAVGEVAVIGIPSERMGEEILACVVKKSGAELTEEELISYCRNTLATYKTPKRVIFLNELPRNGVGKIMKRKLRDAYKDTELPI